MNSLATGSPKVARRQRLKAIKEVKVVEAMKAPAVTPGMKVAALLLEMGRVTTLAQVRAAMLGTTAMETARPVKVNRNP